jgi:hypothetical protein
MTVPIRPSINRDQRAGHMAAWLETSPRSVSPTRAFGRASTPLRESRWGAKGTAGRMLHGERAGKFVKAIVVQRGNRYAKLRPQRCAARYLASLFTSVRHASSPSDPPVPSRPPGWRPWPSRAGNGPPSLRLCDGPYSVDSWPGCRRHAWAGPVSSSCGFLSQGFYPSMPTGDGRSVAPFSHGCF